MQGEQHRRVPNVGLAFNAHGKRVVEKFEGRFLGLGRLRGYLFPVRDFCWNTGGPWNRAGFAPESRIRNRGTTGEGDQGFGVGKAG